MPSNGGFELASLARKAVTACLLIPACFLFWYSVCTFRLSGENPAGLPGGSARFFPEALVLTGNGKYLALDPAGAAECYRRAIAAEPSIVDAWIGLARTEIANGKEDEARRVLGIISPAIASIGTWKCREMLLALYLKDRPYFETCFNFILTFLPHHTDEACWISASFFGGWDKTVSHVLPANRPAFLREIIWREKPDAVVILLETIEKEGPPLGRDDQLQLCDFLISNGRLKEAKRVWTAWRKGGTSLIDDGKFEAEPLNKAFGWRAAQSEGATVERASRPPCPDTPCLHIHFSGLENPGRDLVSQVVPVRPGAKYRLEFRRRGSGLTTDRGVFVAVGEPKGEKYLAASEPVTGDVPWEKEELEFGAPEGCEAVTLHVRRDESLRMDNRISGDYWLREVEMTEK